MDIHESCRQMAEQTMDIHESCRQMAEQTEIGSFTDQLP